MTSDASGLCSPMTLPDLMVAALARDPPQPALVLEDGTGIPVRELRAIVSTWSQALASLGLGPRARIALLSRNRAEVVYVFSVTMFGNHCLTPLHPMGSVDDFAFALADAQIECLIYEPQHFEDVARELAARVGTLRHLLALGPTAAGQDLAALAAGFEPRPLVAPPTDPEDIARIVYSGGTTGRPKGIMLSQRCIATSIAIQLAEWEWPAEVRALVSTPLSHASGSLLLPTLLRGGTLHVLPAFDAVAVLAAIEQHRITCTMLVPTMIYALLDHPRFGEFDLSSLEAVYYGASTILPARLREAIERIGPVFFQFYGQSEAPMTVTVLRRAEHDTHSLTRLASCGRPVPWVRVALLDAAGCEVPDGEPGEICVRGPLLMSGYLGRPELTAEAFAGGWLHSGDVAVRDADGFLRIVDRSKDMIITGGFNVYPREVEDALTSHPAVAEAAVVGVPHPKWGEAVTAAVVLRPGARVGADELIALVRARKGAVQAPKSVHFVERIPLSSLGKPDKKAVRVLLQQRLA